MQLPSDIDELRRRVQDGEQFEFLFFWGHRPPKDGSIDKSCLSQWYPAAFKVDGITCATAEHWMMAEKARLFGDEEALERIIAAPDPKTAKALGRKVQDFEPEV